MYEPKDLAPYLAISRTVDGDHSAIAAQARRLGAGNETEFGTVRRCFEWVSNRIPHSMDCAADSVPCSASEVITAGHGLCYAKSHLLAALLRANGIPAGFDYQRLGSSAEGYALHGVNTVYLPVVGWLRLDPRGEPGATVRLPAPGEHIIFPATGPGELNYGLNLPEPAPKVVRALRSSDKLSSVIERLPASVCMG